MADRAIEKPHLVQCRICHYPIDINKEKENIDWIQPSKGWYYHKECYETWKAAPATDEEWVLMIFDFLARDLKVNYNYFLCKQQIENFWKKQKINPKGIYFSLKYFYEVKKNPWEKGHGGIGIVPYVFDDAKAYWIQQEQKKRGFMKQMEQQAKERTIVHVSRTERRREKYDLDSIGGED